MFLVVAATNRAEVNEAVFREAQRRGVLCNAVDDPSRCDFYYPAVVRRGELQIAISTGGLSPALAQRLRRDLELQFGAEYETWIEHLGRLRHRLRKSSISRVRQVELLHAAASREAFVLKVRKRAGSES
jgi:precorrin-2 dehydrogenase/sirohydrochlorin ferrochelatase